MINITNIKNRAGLVCALVLGAVALPSLAAAQVFPDSVHVDFGTLASGTLKSLYANDGSAYSVTTATESGSNYQVAAFLCTFPIGDAAYASDLGVYTGAMVHETLSVPVAGCVLQAYVYKADGTVEYLGFVNNLPTGTSTQEFFVSGDQVSRFKDAAGEIRIQFRVFRPQSAGTGAFACSVDTGCLIPATVPSSVQEVEGQRNNGSFYSLYAQGDGSYTMQTQHENGSNNQVASFVCPFTLPLEASSATVFAWYGGYDPGYTLQSYILNSFAAGGNDFLDFRTMRATEGGYTFPVSTALLAKYRDATTGVTQIQMRQYRAPKSSSDANADAYLWGTSQLVVFAGPSNGPAYPTGLSASLDPSGGSNLAWTDNANNETGYVIERKGGADAAFRQVGTAGTDAMDFHDPSSLSPGTTYTYRVRSRNGNGNSAPSNAASVTTSR